MNGHCGKAPQRCCSSVATVSRPPLRWGRWQNSLVLYCVLGITLATFAAAESGNLGRLTYHPWVRGPSRQPGQHLLEIPSALVSESGERVGSADDWYGIRRPKLVELWTRVLGKLRPEPEDRKWFGDITRVEVYSQQEREGYTRIHLGLPMEVDFLQDHLLLLPKNSGAGPFPAVIAWTATSSNFDVPEHWWGSYLARHGFVVLVSRSFIKKYRGGKSYLTGVNEELYDRFGHWLPMGKMVHDVSREVEYLKSRPEVEEDRIGFIGFSLSAKAAIYVGAFVPEIKATVSIDPGVALNGRTNWFKPWYLDWLQRFPGVSADDYPMHELRGTVLSLLNPDVGRPGLERNHHEVMALTAPRAFMLIGGRMADLHNEGYCNRASEVYQLLGISERFEYVPTPDGHSANGPHIDPAWQGFFQRWLVEQPVDFDGY